MLYSVVPLLSANAKTWCFEGVVLDGETKEPIVGVIFNLEGTGLWTLSDVDGHFSFPKIQQGDYKLKVSCLGYVEKILEIDINQDITDYRIELLVNSLALEGVVVAAERKSDDMNTTMSFGTNALEHLQMSNITDVGTLLPGGKTVNPDLTTDNRLSIRDGGSSVGNAAFGTALEVDGVRLGNNASFGDLAGNSTRSISVENIGSIEVITGVPSAEYGDLNSGMVKINTRKGKTPWMVTMAVNPRTYQLSASKGFQLGDDKGVLNVSGEWTRATKKLSSPYESYARRGLSLSYSNTFAKVLRFEFGLTGNLGGMNSKDDPDAYSGTWEKGRDNVVRANTSLTYLLNKSWITNLKFDASVNYNDTYTQSHQFFTSSSSLPSVHSKEEGYFLAQMLPASYFSDKIVDSKTLDFASSLKYDWYKRWSGVKNHLKAGVQWKANGNVGQGEYYLDSALAANGYRSRPYTDFPFMHNLAVYIEDNITIPISKTSLQLSAGLRMENLFVEGTKYKDVYSFSPRFNLKWKLSDAISIRGGWGVSEKLPSFYVLFPYPEYRDIRTFDYSSNGQSYYVYYTQPYELLFNENLRWQRASNSEFGIDAQFAGFKVSLVGFYNKTLAPYQYSSEYNPFSYNVMQVPSEGNYVFGTDNPVRVNSTTGDCYLVNATTGELVPMDLKVRNTTFIESKYADNGADVTRAGVEMIVDFPEIKAIRTKFRLDASYTHSYYLDQGLNYFYRTGTSHTSEPNKSYQYAGIYVGTSGASTINGKKTHNCDVNLTSTTHIPQAKIIITCKLELSVLRRSQNLSEYNSKEYAFNVSESSLNKKEGSIYDGNSYTAIYPIQYIDTNGKIHDFTEEDAQKSEFAQLIIRSGNAYTFKQDGYGPYMSANISVTKEIGKHISLSFFANNFTKSRMHVTSMATGVSAIFTPNFYYGLTCRLKF